MWTLVFRKILNNKWMMLCLLFGFIVVVAMVSAVPMYSNAILQKMFNDDLIEYQLDHSIYAGMYQARASYGQYDFKDDTRERAYNSHNAVAEEKMAEISKICNTDRYVSTAKAMNMILTPYDEQDIENSAYKKAAIDLNSVKGMEDYVTFIAGRMYEPGKNSSGEYEFICTEAAYNELALNLDSVYRIASITKPGEYTYARLVGVFTMAENTSDYWYIAGGIEKYSNNILMDYDTMLHMLFKDYSGIYLYEVEWRMAIDFTVLSIDNLTTLIEGIESHILFYDNETGFSYFRVPMYDTLVSYTQRSMTLKLELWVILAPILVMLALYIFMVTKTIIANDADEISVLRSRGASAKQIFIMYLYESIILGGIALIIGPFVAYLMCIVMGSANGFLEFIGRSALPVKINLRVYLYAFGAVAFFVITMLIPALSAARSTIVERKRRHSRFAGQSLWKKFFLDIILLGASIYGYFNYQALSNILTSSGGNMENYGIDPVLFLLSSIFIIGAGLLFLRIYPLIVRLIFLIGRRKWSPDSYAAFIQVSRSDGREQFLMLFLILSVAVGIFSANAARTLNQNIEDRIRYDTGSDIKLTVEWQQEQAYDIEGRPIDGQYINIEPDFTMYQNIEGVKSAAKVYENPNAKVQSKANSSSQSGITMLALDAAEFAKVTWTRNDLFEPYHINAYLKLLHEAKRSVILSRPLAEKLNVSVGDVVNVSINEEPSCEMIVYALIDYWPSIQPIDPNGRASRRGGTTYEHFIICNLTFINSKFTKYPYNIWLDKEDGVTDTEIFNYIDEHRELRVASIEYVDQQLIAQKNDPQLQGFNGMLTLGFIITMFICVIGFLIYWIISIKSRTMQFGVLRAMGMPFSGILRMILIEQLLISFASILIGIILGGIASDMFVPMLELMFPLEQHVPSFIVVALRSDYFKVYGVIIVMLAAGIGVLARMIGRTKMDQALKLGED